MIRYGRFHMDAGTVPSDANVVHPDSLLQMREPSMPILGTPMQMGLDWFVQDVAGHARLLATAATPSANTPISSASRGSNSPWWC